MIDCLIHARWIIPVKPAKQVLINHSLAIHAGKILDILPTLEAVAKYRTDTIHDLSHHALIPGLINAHTHTAMSLLRGLADDLPLMAWLNQHIWPAESRWVNTDFVRDGTRLAIAEMLKSGTTCLNDMYFFPDVTANVAIAAGMRACIGLIAVDFPTVWAANTEEYLHKGVLIHTQFRDEPLIRTAFAPHAPYSVNNAPLQQIQILADQLGLPIHMHVHETIQEIEHSLQQYGMRPLQRLDQLGLLTPGLMAAHMTQLNEQEIQRLAKTRSSIIHCPESNMKLASGLCPVAHLLQAGVNVALGTDGAASNNNLDMLGEMRSAALLGKIAAQDAAALPAHEVLQMATLNGAKALGIDHLTGSLEIGKAADITAINLTDINTQPLYHPISQIVYASHAHQVTDVWVAGKHCLDDRQLTTLDETAILSKALEWGFKIADAPNSP